jgi:hypothetical protein
MSCRTMLLCGLALVAVAVMAQSSAAEITVEKSPAGAVVKIDGQLFTEYITDSEGTPILWPLIGPTGQPMTRSYPMAEKEGEKHDHPHHRSVWFTHGNVNGLDFWSLGKGTIKHREFVKLQSGPQGVIVTRNDWLAPDGTRQCEDERTLTFGTDGDSRWIDYDVTVKADDIPVTFGDTKEGTFGMRVAATIKVDAKQGGQIVNSEGQTDKDAWAKQAAWVDYHGPIDGQTVGIAIFNHPSSYRFPTYWHVRTYGLFAANPFGLQSFLGSKDVNGAATFQPGESFTVRYRVLLHKGDEKQAKVAEAYAKYAAEPK